MNKLTTIAFSLLTANLAACIGDDLRDPPVVVPQFAQTCADIALDPTAADGEHTLYLGGDQTKPWTAYCVDLQSAPKEYLSLLQGGNLTWSMYRAGGSATGTDVETRFDKVRIDPVTLALDTGDTTFAVSTGSLVDSAGKTFTSMPLGVALTCGGGYATAQVDVDGTPFVIEDHFALTGSPSAVGHAGLWASLQVVEIWADGDCGSIAPVNAQITLDYQR